MVDTDIIEETEAESFIERRNLLLKDLDPQVIRKAWFTLSHLLLDEGSHIVDMGCDDGEMTFAMAAMAPKMKFTGLDKAKRQINKAKEKYKLFNLDFKVGDAASAIFDDESIDAIINSYVLHEVYSASRYNEQIVSDTLETQFKALKKGGVMFIRDFARPPPEEFVLLELPDEASEGKDLAHLSDADLLIWYAEHARPKQDAGCGGFFLEELPERYPNTRLFRLPYKWAYEFIMRKDERSHWDSELPMEYTFFTMREFRKELRALGSRVQYSGPIYDDEIINEKFEGRFRLYEDNGRPLGNPPTCYIAVAYKMAERKSLHIEERRPSIGDASNLKIIAMRNDKTGELSDVVSRDLDVCEVIPYRVDEEGRLKVYLHDGIARSITNAVMRGGINIDGKRWSGHMIEPLSVNTGNLPERDDFDHKNSVLFARDYLGLKPEGQSVLEHGPDYYPAPEFIDERIHTYYLEVRKAKSAVQPKSVIGVEKFQAKGVIREFDAQQVLNAITVGMIPSARLELQILALMKDNNVKPESWIKKNLGIHAGKISSDLDLARLLDQLTQTDNRFQKVKGTSGELRPVHSTFVEEGQSRGSITGLSAENIDFVIHDNKTINTVVVLPLTTNLKKDIHAGFQVQHLPVPQRYDGTGAVMMLPSFNLPAEIRTEKEIKKFVADKFDLLPHMVIKMGEPYYSHIGVTPQKILPYAIAAPPDAYKDPDTLFMPLWQLMIMWKQISRSTHMMTLIARSYKYFADNDYISMRRESKMIQKAQMMDFDPKWSIPVAYERIEALNIEALKSETGETNELELEQKLKENLGPTPGLTNTSGVQPFHERMRSAEADAEPQSANETARVNYEDENISPEEDAELEAELKAFIEVLEKDSSGEPRPEKW